MREQIAQYAEMVDRDWSFKEPTPSWDEIVFEAKYKGKKRYGGRRQSSTLGNTGNTDSKGNTK